MQDENGLESCFPSSMCNVFGLQFAFYLLRSFALKQTNGLFQPLRNGCAVWRYFLQRCRFVDARARASCACGNFARFVPIFAEIAH